MLILEGRIIWLRIGDCNTGWLPEGEFPGLFQTWLINMLATGGYPTVGTSFQDLRSYLDKAEASAKLLRAVKIAIAKWDKGRNGM